MNNESEKYIGYLKYSWKLVEDWLLDIKKSADALLGFNEILRYFLIREEPKLSNINFEIPVRIKKGSREVLIPEIIDKFISIKWVLVTAWTASLTAYWVQFWKTLAKDWLFETWLSKDVKKIFKATFISIQWIIKIAIHIWGFVNNKIKKTKIKQNNQDTYICIYNINNQVLEVPKKYFDLFQSVPEKLFSKTVKIVDIERKLEFWVFNVNEVEKVTITEKEKYIFYNEEDDDDIVLPELKHWYTVELEWEITRATESTNSIWFRYKWHTLVCKPKDGHIVQFKNKIISNDNLHFFPKVILKWMVDRKDRNWEIKEKKPQILFFDIIPINDNKNQTSLF